MDIHPAARTEDSRLIHHAPLPRLWTPEHGASGLLVIARPRPLAVVVGGRVLTRAADEEEPFRGRRRTVTLQGLVIINSTRQSEPTRIIGHPDLASGTSVRHRDMLYISIGEAVYRQSQGEEVEIHLTPNPDDEEALGAVRARARRRWEGDHLPDGWTRPLPPPPTSKEEPPRPGGDDLPDELRALADRIRARNASSPDSEAS